VSGSRRSRPGAMESVTRWPRDVPPGPRSCWALGLGAIVAVAGIAGLPADHRRGAGGGADGALALGAVGESEGLRGLP
jgi:hypothetical protein